MIPLPDRLLIVSDRHQAARPLAEQLSAAMAGGARWVWLRDRDLPREDRLALAWQVRREARHHGARLTIGGDITLAREVQADGVHLGAVQDVAAARAQLGTGALVGLSCHSLDDVSAAAQAGADYVTLSPIFVSASKPGYGPALGTAALSLAASHGVPILALGGVDCETAAACIAAGSWGVAVMGPMMRSTEPARLVAAFRTSLA